jgi:acyl-CoA hydrolase/RimJ/RimL family protein N-acetyltransferase
LSFSIAPRFFPYAAIDWKLSMATPAGSKGIKAPSMPVSFHPPAPGDEPFLEAALSARQTVWLPATGSLFPFPYFPIFPIPIFCFFLTSLCPSPAIEDGLTFRWHLVDNPASRLSAVSGGKLMKPASPQTDSGIRCASPEKVLAHIEPGMNIFVGTGAAEPQTLVRRLMEMNAANLQDLTLVQLVSLGDMISIEELRSHKYRLKTFYSGWVANEAIAAGRVDLIPSRFSRIPLLIRQQRIPIDAVFVQVSEPDAAGYCSLGISVDVARYAIEQAKLVVGEICQGVPRTFGDTLIPASEFSYLVQGTESPMTFPRWPANDTFDRVAANLASVIENGTCLMWSIGPLFDALGPHLAGHKNLGIHAPFFTDTLMDLVKSGAVSNRKKNNFRGKCLTSYAIGSADLYHWLDRNPLVEFQSVNRVFNPMDIGHNPRFNAIFPARKVDLSGCIALPRGKGSVTAGPGQVMDFVNGAEISCGGLTIFALPSRNLKKEPNIHLSIEDFPDQLNIRDSVDMVVTDHGIAYLSGRSLRVRAQALIEVAHPEDRAALVRQAREARILYEDQIFIDNSTHLYPSEIAAQHILKDGTRLRVRAIKSSDEEEMRQLFYRFSDETVYYRYFSPIKTMPHAKMQQYVTVDYAKTMSVIGLVGERGQGRIVAEARYVKDPKSNSADVAFVVDEKYQGNGIATFLYNMLIRLARERGIRSFTADVLTTNRGMIKVFEKGMLPVKTKLEGESYHLIMPFGE